MKKLESDRLKYRQFTMDDVDAVHGYAGVVDNVIYMMWGPNTKEQTEAFIDQAMVWSKEIPCTNYQYAAVLKESGELIGGCNLAISDNEGEIGWILHKDYWRQGYGAEMGQEMLRLAFDELNLHRVSAHCDKENVGSYKIMEKIGMRREGVFLESRPAHKLSNREYGGELSYAMLGDEWQTQKEIKYYLGLPCVFKGFMDLPELSDGEIHLVCLSKNPAIEEKKYVPSYHFAICKGSEKVGEIDLRIGYGSDSSSLYYGGQIGYGIHEEHRGNGYAHRACQLLLPVARYHGMTKLLITNDTSNVASRRVCEKLGARFLRVARLPQWIDLYKSGQRFVNVYEWSVE